MEQVIANLAGNVRRETLNGRDHLVAPVVLLRSGILHGSQGPLYYPPEEVSANFQAWNGVPLVIDHPKTEIGHVSAKAPGVLGKQGVGELRYARIDNGNLKGEAWVDEKRAQQVWPDLLNQLQAGNQVEVSTGLYTDNTPAHNGAQHNGQPYKQVARNYRPDHLAILPTATGACSVEDGCGLNVNRQAKEKAMEETVVDNRLSHQDLRRELQKAIEARYGLQAVVLDVFNTDLVYDRAGNDHSPSYMQPSIFKLGYKLKGEKVSLADGPGTEVVRTTDYKPVKNEDTDDVENEYVENPKGQWTPPESGDAPKEVKAILSSAYSAFRDKNPAEEDGVKARGAQIAWGAVKKAGWEKGADGKWSKATNNEDPTENAISERLLEQLQDRFGDEVEVVRTAGNSVTFKNRGKTLRLSYSGKGDAARISGGKPLEITENADVDNAYNLSQPRDSKGRFGSGGGGGGGSGLAISGVPTNSHPASLSLAADKATKKAYDKGTVSDHMVASQKHNDAAKEYKHRLERFPLKADEKSRHKAAAQYHLDKKKAHASVTRALITEEEKKRVTPLRTNKRNGRSGSKRNFSRGGSVMTDQERDETVDFILANCGHCDDDDRETLNELDDEKLAAWRGDLQARQESEAVVNAVQEAAGGELAVNAMPDFIKEKIAAKKKKASDDGEEEEEVEEKKPAANEQLTDEQWMEAAPDSVKEVFKFSEGIMANERKTIVDRLTVNVAKESKEALVNKLNGMTLPDLRDLSALAPPEPAAKPNTGVPSIMANYFGAASQAGPTVPVANKKVTPLPLPASYIESEA